MKRASAILLVFAACTGDAKDYEYTSDWFTPHLAGWEATLERFEDRPNVSYLEVGTYEGRALFWTLANVLTGPGSRATVVDFFYRDREPYFRHNLKASGEAHRVDIKKGNPGKTLRDMSERFDVIFLNSGDTIGEKLTDTLLAWDLLKDGGVMIFSDYGQHEEGGHELPKNARPSFAVDWFITLHRDEVVILRRGYQLIVEKFHNACLDYADGDDFSRERCTPLGAYVFSWKTERLIPDFPLTAAEVTLVEKLFHSRDPGTSDFFSPELMAKPEVVSLLKRLSVDVR